MEVCKESENTLFFVLEEFISLEANMANNMVKKQTDVLFLKGGDVVSPANS